MSNNLSKFRNDIRESLQKLRPMPDYRSVARAFEFEMECLLADGLVSLGPDHELSGPALEFKVRNIFSRIGYVVEKGDVGHHDGIIKPPENFQPVKSVVLEIKSSKNLSPGRDDLRQLDDWVFELSGEEKARKEGLGGGGDIVAFATAGMFTSRQYHPNPHKGAMVFNGPLGVVFNNRPSNWLGANECEFAKKRNFSIISFACLLSWYEACQKDKALSIKLWEAIHSTCGILEYPNVA